MNDKFKKILLWAGFAAVVILIGWGLYYLFFRTAPTTEVANINGLENLNQLPAGQLPELTNEQLQQLVEQNQNQPNVLPEIKPEQVAPVAAGGYTKVNQLASGNVFQPVLAKGKALNYFDAGLGKFYSVNSSGVITPVSEQKFYSVQNIVWDNSGSKAVIQYPDGSNIVYDFNTNKQYNLPKEFQNFAWSTDGTELGAEAFGPAEENNWIVTVNPDGSNLQFVERLGANSKDVVVNWSPNKQVVALYRQNVSNNAQQIIMIGRNQENFKALDVYGRGFSGQWTPKGDQILYSVFRAENNFLPSLWVASATINAIGASNIDLGLNTWADKCTISSDDITAYCAVPQYLPAGSGIYRDLASGTTDQIYQINLTNGQKTLLAIPVYNQQGVSINKIYLADDNSKLFFQDSQTGSLNSINIK